MGGELGLGGDEGIAGAGGGELGDQVRLRQDGGKLVAQPRDDLGARADRREQALPERDLVARIGLGAGLKS